MRQSYNIVLTDSCFFRCSHCFLTRGRTDLTQDFRDVARIVRYISGSNDKITINWGGGDPLATGKSYMSDIVQLPCFDDSRISNVLYSTFHIDFDATWASILGRFDSVMLSIDRYRTAQRGFSISRALGNVSAAGIGLDISYTPHHLDSTADADRYYRIALDAGARAFHMGLLYSDRLIDPELYIRLLDRLMELECLHAGPRIGFFHRKEMFGEDLRAASGWRAYDCFTRGLYFAPDGTVTSCYIMHSRGHSVPAMETEKFIAGDFDIHRLNEAFVREFFMRRNHPECLACEYFTLCVGGCPYFVMRAAGGKDYYCSLYKRIFEILLSYAPESACSR